MLTKDQILKIIQETPEAAELIYNHYVLYGAKSCDLTADEQQLRKSQAKLIYYKKHYAKIKSDPIAYAKYLACVKEYQKNNSEKVKEYQKYYYNKIKSDPIKYAKYLTKQKEYRENNSEKIKAYYKSPKFKAKRLQYYHTIEKYDDQIVQRRREAAARQATKMSKEEKRLKGQKYRQTDEWKNYIKEYYNLHRIELNKRAREHYKQKQLTKNE